MGQQTPSKVPHCVHLVYPPLDFALFPIRQVQGEKVHDQGGENKSRRTKSTDGGGWGWRGDPVMCITVRHLAAGEE